MYKRINVVVLIAFLLAVLGCGGQSQIKPITEMAPKEKATWMLGVYNAQYKDYQQQAAMADSLTEEAREVMRAKKEILTKVYPLIKMYNGYVDTGVLPDKEVEEQIITLLNSLLMQ